MGSNISGILAISYMYLNVEHYSSAHHAYSSQDILMLTSSSEEATAIYEKF